jgi:hypothetical protein
MGGTEACTCIWLKRARLSKKDLLVVHGQSGADASRCPRRARIGACIVPASPKASSEKADTIDTTE